MENIIPVIAEFCTNGVMRIILALAAWFIGRMIISFIMKGIKKTPSFAKLDQTVALFMNNIIKTVLYIVLVISIIGIVGVPMASIVAVLASAGVAVGMALQGALGNVAGGIMLMIFRPFNVGDYVDAGGVEGTVSEIGLFYTVITTPQNSRITVPNGTLMGANVTNYTANPKRRIDINFTIGKDSDPEAAMKAINDVAMADESVLKEPLPYAAVCGGSDTAIELILRAWVLKDDYIPVREGLIKKTVQAFGKAGITAPAVRVITDK